jgi:hypothetical protein
VIHAFRWLVTGGLAATIVLTLANPHAMLAPGPMSRGHESRAQNCLACHVPGGGTPVSKCVGCHPVERIGRFTVAGEPVAAADGRVAASFHARLAERRCLACHTEHAGGNGRREGRSFSHELLDAATRDSCATCHRPPDDALHRDAGGSCASCHTNARWKPATFDHERLFPLRGEHAVACASCHAPGGFERYSCTGCHEHSPDRVARQHAEEGITNLDDCVRCHRGGRREGGEGGHEGGFREGGDGERGRGEGRRRRGEGGRRDRGGDDD